MTEPISEQCKAVCNASEYDFSNAAGVFVDAISDAENIGSAEIFKIGRDLNSAASVLKKMTERPHECLVGCFGSAVSDRLKALGQDPDSLVKKNSVGKPHPLPLSLMIGKLPAEDLQLASDIFGYDYFAGLTGWKSTIVEIGIFAVTIFGCFYGVLTGVAAGQNSFMFGTSGRTFLRLNDSI